MALKDWSETAADNDDSDATINWAEGQAPSTVNGSARSMMATIKKSLGHIVSVRDYGAVGDGSTDDTSAIQDAIDAATAGSIVTFPKGAYEVTGITVDKALTLRGEGVGYGIGAPTVRLLAAGAQDFILKFDNLTTDENGLVVGGGLENILIDGADNTISDAGLVVEGFTVVNFVRSGVQEIVGNGMRLRIVWDSLFDRFFVRGVDSSGGGKAVVYIDSRYDSNDDLNVNNTRFLKCHFEACKGTHFLSQSDSNLDALQIMQTKFERGVAVAGGPFPVFNFVHGLMIDISHNKFFGFKSTENYDKILKTTTGTFSCFENDFSGIDATTYWLDNGAAARTIFKNNRNWNSGDVSGLLTNTSAYALDFEFPSRMDASRSRNATGFQRKTGTGWRSSHEAAHNNNLFATDSNVTNLEGTVVKTSNANTRLLTFEFNSLLDYPSAIRVGVRARSESGAGGIELFASGVSQGTRTLASSYASAWWDLPHSTLDALTSLTLDSITGNAENVYVDEWVFEHLPWQYFGSATYNPSDLADGGGETTTVTVTSASVGDRVDVTFSNDLQGINLHAWVSASNTVSVRFQNETGGNVNLGNGTLRAWVTKRV